MYTCNSGTDLANTNNPIKSPDINVVNVMTIKVNILVYKVTSNRDDPIRNNFSWALGNIASAQTLNDTSVNPTGWKVGDNSHSAAANKINPIQIATAQAYSVLEKILRCINDATIMVGMSLQDRKTTLVGKLIKFNAKSESADDETKQKVNKG